MTAETAWRTAHPSIAAISAASGRHAAVGGVIHGPHVHVGRAAVVRASSEVGHPALSNNRGLMTRRAAAQARRVLGKVVVIASVVTAAPIARAKGHNAAASAGATSHPSKAKSVRVRHVRCEEMERTSVSSSLHVPTAHHAGVAVALAAVWVWRHAVPIRVWIWTGVHRR